MPEQLSLVGLGCCIGLVAGTTFGVIFMGRLIAASQRAGYVEENQMDKQKIDYGQDNGVVENIVKCRVLVNCPLDRSAYRLVNDHNFVVLPEYLSHYGKTMEGTWSDIMIYAESLRGIEGIAKVDVIFGDESQRARQSPSPG